VNQAQPFDGHWDGRYVFYPGELLYFNVTGGTWDVSASGYLLTGLPPEIVMPPAA
jgi:hypothetical protein